MWSIGLGVQVLGFCSRLGFRALGSVALVCKAFRVQGSASRSSIHYHPQSKPIWSQNLILTIEAPAALAAVWSLVTVSARSN